MNVLDLFSAACGGWSLGMHRAGFRTMAACEAVDWRRVLYSQNNPGVKVYDDVRTLTARRLLADFGYLPSVVVGSPPCQDISSANTKGKGVDGERSGLFFEAVRIIGEIRDLGRERGTGGARWFALENSANLRTRGADRVVAALAAIGYTCWPFVVGADDVGANHERKRSWLIGCDLEQVADADGIGSIGFSGRGFGLDASVSADTRDTAQVGCGSRISRGYSGAARRAEQRPCGDAPHTDSEGEHASSERGEVAELSGLVGDSAGEERNTPHPDQAHGCMVSGIRQEEIAVDGCGDGWRPDRSGERQMGLCPPDRRGADGSGPLWSLANLAGSLLLDDGLPVRLAGTRVAVGGPRGAAAASLAVEAYGDAVIPQIPEAIGRAILRVEHAMRAVAHPQGAK